MYSYFLFHKKSMTLVSNDQFEFIEDYLINMVECDISFSNSINEQQFHQ